MNRNILGFPPKGAKERIAIRTIDGLKEAFTPVLECPLCGGTEFPHYIKGSDPEESYLVRYSRCPCGMMFQPEFMQQELLDKYYQTAYRSTVPPYAVDIQERNVVGEYENGKRYMQFSNGIEPKKHLDIGSSTGSFMKLIQDTYGCESLGVEPGDDFRHFCIDVVGIDAVADISEVVGKYDYITLAHVLEHFINPLDKLATIRDLLEDDGRMFVEVPYMGLSFSHTLLFKEELLERMLTKAGFVKVKSQFEKPHRIMMIVKKKEIQ